PCGGGKGCPRLASARRLREQVPGLLSPALGEKDLLQFDTWSKIFYEPIDEVKPEDEWDLKMDQGPTPEALPWGWTRVVEKRGLAG
uniref:Uncharacterized protein n=1 Tax=Otus sunia TaxID=257818 RepID=A0A8C8AU71_9STRI